MVKKKKDINVYAVCHRAAMRKGIQKDSITHTKARSKFVESCVLSIKKKQKKQKK